MEKSRAPKVHSMVNSSEAFNRKAPYTRYRGRSSRIFHFANTLEKKALRTFLFRVARVQKQCETLSRLYLSLFIALGSSNDRCITDRLGHESFVYLRDFLRFFDCGCFSVVFLRFFFTFFPCRREIKRAPVSVLKAGSSPFNLYLSLFEVFHFSAVEVRSGR